MPEPLPISQVEIIGYANRLASTMLPAVVPPLFRSKAEPHRFFLPPYLMQDGCIWNFTERAEAELSQLEHDGEVTFFSAPFEALPDFELWIDQQNCPHYEPVPVAAKALRAIAEDCINSAVEALQEGDHAKAKELCRTAMSADDRLLEPLAIRAAIARRENEKGQQALMTKLAHPRSTGMGFELMVAGYEKMIAGHACASPVPDLLSHHPMSGMAVCKAA